jgi:alpha-L-fucosidase
MTMNGTWGYKSYDDNWKPPKTLVRNLIDIASKGGNYLLNIGPKPDGTIPQESIDRLKEVGQWMKVNGEAIYGTTACPTRLPAWGRITTKAGDDVSTLYLHVFDWSPEGKLPVSIANEPVSCHLLADSDRTFDLSSDPDTGLTVQLSGEPADDLATVLVLTVKGRPNAIPYYLKQAEDGQVVLNAADAELNGSLKVESKYGKPNIGYWLNRADTAEWNLTVAKPGKFDVVAEIAAAGKSRFSIVVDGKDIACEVSSTGGYDKFREEKLGTLELGQTGKYKLTIAPDQDAWSPLNVRTITLRPSTE